MTLSKETLEAAAPAAKTAAPAAPSKHDLSRLRADAVSLDVPVKVHGSRVTEVVRGVTPHTEPFEEETSTMIVFPHGGVVRMATIVNVGQMLVLTNQRTNQDAICRVVKVRAYSNSQAYVEVEFTHRQLGYWGVHFPADDEDTLASEDSALPPPAEKPQEKIPVVASLSMKIENMPKAAAPPPAAARNESAFAQIGSQEEVQLAATQMDVKRRTAPPVPTPQVRASAPVAPPVASVAPPVTHVAPSPLRVVPSRDLIEDEPIEAAFEPEVEAPRPSRTFGTLTGGVAKASPRAAEPDAHLESPAVVPAQAAAPRSGNWMWIAACAFFLVTGLAGSALYFRQHPSNAPQSVANSASAQPAEQNFTSAAQPQEGQPAANFAPVPAPAATVAERPSRASIQPPVQQDLNAVQLRGANNPLARETKPAAAAAPAPMNFAATAAHPMARRKAGGAAETEAPSVGVAPATTGALPDVLSASNAAPLPPPMTRVRVGGVIIEPKLLRSVPPFYPTAARQAGITGNVVINAEVDKTGNVVSTKVVSGPATLQAAAMSAMKQWKYQPATLDSEPIATQVTVTIKFQQQ
jgi:protein TonB